MTDFKSGFASDLSNMITLKVSIGGSAETYLPRAKVFDTFCFAKPRYDIIPRLRSEYIEMRMAATCHPQYIERVWISKIRVSGFISTPSALKGRRESRLASA